MCIEVKQHTNSCPQQRHLFSAPQRFCMDVWFHLLILNFWTVFLILLSAFRRWTWVMLYIWFSTIASLAKEWPPTRHAQAWGLTDGPAKTSASFPLEPVKMFPYLAKWALEMWFHWGSWAWKIILDYPSRPDVISRILTRERGRRIRAENGGRGQRDMTLALKMERGQEPRTAAASREGSGKETGSPLKSAKEEQSCQDLDFFSPVTLTG